MERLGKDIAVVWRGSTAIESSSNALLTSNTGSAAIAR